MQLHHGRIDCLDRSQNTGRCDRAPLRDPRRLVSSQNIDMTAIPNANYSNRYPLSGKTGDQKEGMIDLVLSFTSASSIVSGRAQPTQPVVFVPNVSGRALPVYVQPQQQPQQVIHQPPAPVQPLTDEDISNLMEMFPSVDKEVIKSIGEANRGNKEATVNFLLQLTN